MDMPNERTGKEAKEDVDIQEDAVDEREKRKEKDEVKRRMRRLLKMN
jgi:hypothetical protein